MELRSTEGFQEARALPIHGVNAARFRSRVPLYGRDGCRHVSDVDGAILSPNTLAPTGMETLAKGRGGNNSWSGLTTRTWPIFRQPRAITSARSGRHVSLHSFIFYYRINQA